MKKKILVFILLFMNFAMLKVGANNWDYLPKTNNYFDPDNFFLEGELYTWSFNCLHPFRIKENTVYSLVSKSESDHFFNGVNLIFYNRNLEEIERNPQIRARKYRGYGVMEISFTAPVGAYYLSLDFNFEIMSQPPNNPNDLYDNFVIYEGANDSYFDNYQGADYLNIVISENIYGFYRTNINNPLTVGELKNALKAVDYIDGDLTAEIEVIEDTYSLNCDKIGTYYLTFEVIDKAGNRSEFQIYLEIFDDTPPEVSVIFWFNLFNQVITTDKFLYLFGRIIPNTALLLSMGLRYFPLFVKQSERINQAQKALGIYEEGFFKRTKNYLKTYTALVSWSLENALDTAISMKARGYGVAKRSSYSLYRFRKSDFLFFLLLVLALITLILCADKTYFILAFGSFLFFGGALLEVKENWKWHYLKSKI